MEKKNIAKILFIVSGFMSVSALIFIVLNLFGSSEVSDTMIFLCLVNALLFFVIGLNIKNRKIDQPENDK